MFEIKRKFRELKHTKNIQAYVKKLTTLTLQIPHLIDEEMLFQFMEELQNWAKMELELQYVKTIDEAIAQDEPLTDFNLELYDKVNGKDTRSSHAKGGGDRG